MKKKVQHAEALSHAKSELLGDNVDDKLAALGKEDEIEKLWSSSKRGSKRPADILRFMKRALTWFCVSSLSGDGRGPAHRKRRRGPASASRRC
jgi:hypothetical protein